MTVTTFMLTRVIFKKRLLPCKWAIFRHESNAHKDLSFKVKTHYSGLYLIKIEAVCKTCSDRKRLHPSKCVRGPSKNTFILVLLIVVKERLCVHFETHNTTQHTKRGLGDTTKSVVQFVTSPNIMRTIRKLDNYCRRSLGAQAVRDILRKYR